MEKISTKEKITIEALKLFSEKGYQAVSVADIAEKVGIRAPSLYKHYPSKEEIFDSCIDLFFERMGDAKSDLGMPGSDSVKYSYDSISTDDLIKLAQDFFEFFLLDDIASTFRRLLMIERYNNSRINEIFEELFVYGAVAYEARIFADLIAKEKFKDIDPEILAINFYSPIFFLLNKYDMYPEKIDQAREELGALVREFSSKYSLA